MGIYTNKGLVKHAEKALELKTKYMWGGILRPITDSYIRALKDIYGGSSGTGYSASRWAELSSLAGKGFYGCDCVGLIKSYYWSGSPEGGVGSPNYGAAGYPDTNAGGLYAAARVKGRIATMPEKSGLILYCKSNPHVGIYTGGGGVIECTLGRRGDGVVRSKLGDFGWECWFECPYIEYKDESLLAEPRLKKYTLAYPAAVRAKPSASSERLGRYTAGSVVTVVSNSDTVDKTTGFTYVRVSGSPERWIVKSACAAK